MQTVKIYANGSSFITEMDPVVILRPGADNWQEAVSELDFERNKSRKPDITQTIDPHSIITGMASDGQERMFGLFEGNTGYVMNTEGRTVETIRAPAKPERIVESNKY